jgi:Ca-activated chloride channel family protein
MRTDIKLQHDLIAVESGDRIHVLLELTAPSTENARERPPASLQTVLDRSGSMADGRLVAALQAVDSLLGRLRPEDRFGLVIFDDEVAVPVAAGAVGDASHTRAVLHQIYPGGMTNLGGGLLRGIQESQRIADGNGATLVLLSDGLANEGVLEPAKLEQFAAGAQRQRIVTSTIGIGLGYDEDLLAAIARRGAGNAHFAEHGDAAGAALASEIEGLLDQTVQAASLTVKPTDDVASVHLYNDLPATTIEGGFMVELGSLYAGERRRLLLEVEVPAIAELGLAKVCDLELRWVDVESMKSELATLPISVNVVPGDQAAGRTEDPEVTTELAFQRAQRTKREATDALRDGDPKRAIDGYRSAAADLRSLDLSGAPAGAAAEIAAEAEMFDRLSEEATHDEMRARKLGRADYHMKSRKRGREQ